MCAHVSGFLLLVGVGKQGSVPQWKVLGGLFFCFFCQLAGHDKIPYSSKNLHIMQAKVGDCPLLQFQAVTLRLCMLLACCIAVILQEKRNAESFPGTSPFLFAEFQEKWRNKLKLPLSITCFCFTEGIICKKEKVFR